MIDKNRKKYLEEMLEKSGLLILQDLNFNDQTKIFEGLLQDKSGRKMKVEVSGESGDERFKMEFPDSDLKYKTLLLALPDLWEMQLKKMSPDDIYNRKLGIKKAVSLKEASENLSDQDILNAMKLEMPKKKFKMKLPGMLGKGLQRLFLPKGTKIMEQGAAPEPFYAKPKAGKKKVTAETETESGDERVAGQEEGQPAKTPIDEKRIAEERKRRAYEAGLADRMANEPKEKGKSGGNKIFKTTAKIAGLGGSAAIGSAVIAALFG